MASFMAMPRKNGLETFIVSLPSLKNTHNYEIVINSSKPEIDITFFGRNYYNNNVHLEWYE